jgi:hypothetical protein
MMRSTSSKAKLDRVKSEELPEALRLELISFSQRLTQNYTSFFASPRAKFRVARFLQAQLPPKPQPQGRPGFRDVTEAVHMLNELRRQHPEWPYRRLWRCIYPVIIRDYKSLGIPERRSAAEELRNRARWRRRAHRRAQARKIKP